MTATSSAVIDIAAKRVRTLRITFGLLVALVSLVSLASYVGAPVVVSGASLWPHAIEEPHAPIEAELRQGNPEWSLLYRLFRVLAFSNRALEDWAYTSYALKPVDDVIDDTLRLEREQGQAYFLLHGAPDQAYVVGPQRSAFVDGEIALMIAARQLARREHLAASGKFRGYTPDATHFPPREDLSHELRTRLETLRTRMEQSPVLCAESYPNECWTFCTVVILSAMRIQGELDGTQQYADLIKRWGQVARRRLTDPETGLLISSFTQAGVRGDGPEGSSIWFVAHALRWLDPSLARAQYQAAKRALGVSLFGLGFAREWPAGQAKNFDIDVGSWVPGLEAGAASSGFALLAAHAFDDQRYERDLLTSISLFARPTPGEDFHFAAAGPMGNVVLLYALNQGPLWSRLVEKSQ